MDPDSNLSKECGIYLRQKFILEGNIDLMDGYFEALIWSGNSQFVTRYKKIGLAYVHTKFD